MAFKLIVLAALIAVVRGGAISAPVVAAPLAAAAPVAVAAKLVDSEFDPHPQYTFGYDVQDALTGDSKGQVESRNGDVVQGQYRVADPDGTLRTVDYTSDPINGFNAVVSKSPLVAAAVPARLAAAPVVAAPVAAKVAAPLVAAPVAAPVAYTAPVAYSARFAVPTAYSSSSFVQSPKTFKYAAPLVAAPVVAAKFAAPVAYTAPYVYNY